MHVLVNSSPHEPLGQRLTHYLVSFLANVGDGH